MEKVNRGRWEEECGKRRVGRGGWEEGGRGWMQGVSASTGMLTPVDPGDGGLGDVCTGCHGNDAPRHRCSGYNPNNRSRENPAAASAFRLPAIQQPSTAQRATSRRPINVDELEHEPVAPSMAAATQRWSRSSPGGQR